MKQTPTLHMQVIQKMKTSYSINQIYRLKILVSGTISIKTGSSYVVDTCKNCEFSSDDKQTSGNRTETTSNEIPTILSSTSTKSTNTTLHTAFLNLDPSVQSYCGLVNTINVI